MTKGTGSRLELMMRSDEENVPHVRRCFRDFHPKLEFLLDHISDLFGSFSDQLNTILHDRELVLIARLAKEAGKTVQDFTALVDSNDQGPAVTEAREAKLTYQAREIRILLFLACKRQFMWGAAELLKYKVTPAVGFLRQETESIGLLHLFLKDPSLAVRWSHILSAEDGKNFFKSTQPSLRKVLESFELLIAYDFGSATALHTRLVSLVRGAPIVDRTDCSQPRYSVPYQEVEADRPYRFLLSVLNWIRNQQRILIALAKAFPELDHGRWWPEIEALNSIADELRSHLKRVFPEEYAASETSQTTE
jgi:hypothetical protein